MIRDDFPILREQVYGKPLVYLDNAATSQKPQAVLDAIQYAYTHFNANIHRGVHHLSQEATRHHEEARQTVAQFLNARSANEIIFTKGTTDSINMLSRSFGEAFIQEGDEIIISQLEHHSNIVPWQMLCDRRKARLRVIPLRDDLTLDMDAYKALLNDRTRIVSVAHVSNVLGIINPVAQIIRLAHEKNIPVMLDAAQSAPHLRLDVQALDCDFLALSAHKMYGPTGVGVLYGKEQWLEQLPPAEGGGEMIEHVTFEKTTYNVLPYKFEAGTPNYIGSYATAAAIHYLQNCSPQFPTTDQQHNSFSPQSPTTDQQHNSLSPQFSTTDQQENNCGIIVDNCGQTKNNSCGIIVDNCGQKENNNCGLIVDNCGQTKNNSCGIIVDNCGQKENNNCGLTEAALTHYAEEQLLAIDGITVYAAGQEKAGCISFNVAGLHPYDVGVLLDRQGIAVRTGHHCAEPLINHLGVSGTIRASFAIYNTKQDVDSFINALKRAILLLQK